MQDSAIKFLWANWTLRANDGILNNSNFAKQHATTNEQYENLEVTANATGFAIVDPQDQGLGN